MTQLQGIPLIKQGKVRDIYRLDKERLLIVASDRVSAFDHILNQQIPHKGRILNGISLFWFNRFADRVKNHVLSADSAELEAKLSAEEREYVRDRFVIVRQVNILPFEFIVRGYLTGSYYKMYQADREGLPVPLPEGLTQHAELPAVILTPTTKAESGKDLPLTPKEVMREIGEDTYRFIEDTACRLYLMAKGYLKERGFVLVDTKFEFGMLGHDVVLADEMLTPDSSRYWKTGTHDSYDKQVIRNYLENTGWDKKTPPIPDVPRPVIGRAYDKYREMYRAITGTAFNEQDYAY